MALHGTAFEAYARATSTKKVHRHRVTVAHALREAVYRVLNVVEGDRVGEATSALCAEDARASCRRLSASVLDQSTEEQSMISATQAERAADFSRMHEAGCLVLPNVWNIPSAALVVAAGYPALATTSGGIAFSEGLPDGERIGRDRMLEIAGAIARRFPVPVSADLEAGYGGSPADVAETVRQAIGLGLVGCNIEDSDPETHRLFDFDLAVERIRAGVEAARDAGLPDFVLNARVDTWICQFGTAQENEHEAIRRANAYLAVGARSAFVPGPTDAEVIGRLAKGIRGPLNISTNVGRHFAPSLDDLRALGVRRASLGGALMLATYGFAKRALQHIRERGTFDYADGSISTGEMTRLLETRYE